MIMTAGAMSLLVSSVLVLMTGAICPTGMFDDA